MRITACTSETTPPPPAPAATADHVDVSEVIHKTLLIQERGSSDSKRKSLTCDEPFAPDSWNSSRVTSQVGCELLYVTPQSSVLT